MLPPVLPQLPIIGSLFTRHSPLYTYAMHILHLTPYYAPAYAFGGVVRAVEGLAQALVARGHTLTILTTDALDLQQRWAGPLEEMRDGVRVVRTRNLVYPLRRLNLSTPIGMRQAARRLLDAADVMHVHELRTLENLLVVPEAARRDIPVVLSAHGTLTQSTGRPVLKRLWDRWLSPSVMRRVTAVAGLHAGETDEAHILWKQHGLTARFVTLPNGVDVAAYAKRGDGAAFRSRWRLGTGPVALFMGRLHARKGVLPLAHAFMRLSMPDARLVIAGPDEGMQSALQALAAQDDRIILIGYVESQARLDALAAADVFALPATGEGLSMAMLEAMAAGLPLLIAPGCHFPQAAEAGAGVIVEPDADALAGALHDLLADQTRREAMGAAAQRLAAAHYSWNALAAEWEEVYAVLAE
jgi:glycosyltransferase involved in cell wall biosynthesis